MRVVRSLMTSEIISLERKLRLHDSWYFLLGSVHSDEYLSFLRDVSSLR